MDSKLKSRKPSAQNNKSKSDSSHNGELRSAPQSIRQKIPSCPRDEGDGESVADHQTEDVSREKLSPVKTSKRFKLNIELDVIALLLFVAALCTRFYKLEEPKHIVFDELHYGKYVGLYMKRTFFFDLHPPLGKQLIALVAYLSGFDGKFKFERIGSGYDESVPLFALRFVPALCGSLIIPVAYYLMMELGFKQSTATLAAFLLLTDNALLTQSRFILMESMLLLFSLSGFLCLAKFRKVHNNPASPLWWFYLITTSVLLTSALCVKYVGFWSWCLCWWLVWRDYFGLISVRSITERALAWHALARSLVLTIVPILIYTSVFYIHLSVLNRAGPHDTIMTSAFQASLQGGLASITRGQPVEVSHGSQVTLRHTHGRHCWLHSHLHTYPVRYQDKRGSSHQQQVTCYTFKDVNNWWIVKRPEKNNLVVSQPVDGIKHGDIIQLVHGMTSRALNSHDVSAPMSPHNQEVSCYIDYNISMPAQNLWRVDIANREQVGDVWHSIESMVRLIHVNSSQALKFSGRHLPDWGFNQFEIVTDKIIQQDDTVWNVEEHRYTKSEDEKERERELVNAEMIPLRETKLSFWSKLGELQYKMVFPSQESLPNHMYSSDPFDWPTLTRGIAYWVSNHHNGQIHLLGNVVIWYSGSISLALYFVLLLFYLMRRRRLCFDLSPDDWSGFVRTGEVLFGGYLIHYLPYFFVERTLFLHHYLPAFVFKVLLTAALIEHIALLSQRVQLLGGVFKMLLVCWVASVVGVFKKFCVLSYGSTPLSASDVLKLRWKESWDFIVHK